MFRSHCLSDVSIKIQNPKSNQGSGDEIENDCGRGDRGNEETGCGGKESEPGAFECQ